MSGVMQQSTKFPKWSVMVLVIGLLVALGVGLGLGLGLSSQTVKKSRPKNPPPPDTKIYATSLTSPQQIYRLAEGSWVYGQMCPLADLETGEALPIIVLPYNVGNNIFGTHSTMPVQGLARGVRVPIIEKGYYHISVNITFRYTKTTSKAQLFRGGVGLYLGTKSLMAFSKPILGDAYRSLENMKLNETRFLRFTLTWQGDLDAITPVFLTSGGAPQEAGTPPSGGNPIPFFCDPNPPTKTGCPFQILEWAPKGTSKDTSFSVTKLE